MFVFLWFCAKCGQSYKILLKRKHGFYAFCIKKQGKQIYIDMFCIWKKEISHFISNVSVFHFKHKFWTVGDVTITLLQFKYVDQAGTFSNCECHTCMQFNKWHQFISLQTLTLLSPNIFHFLSFSFSSRFLIPSWTAHFYISFLFFVNNTEIWIISSLRISEGKKNIKRILVEPSLDLVAFLENSNGSRFLRFFVLFSNVPSGIGRNIYRYRCIIQFN